ncbi:MAG: hypothetical protein ABIF06_02380 [bacterium]
MGHFSSCLIPSVLHKVKEKKPMSRTGKAPFTSALHKQTLTFAGAVLAQLPQITEAEQQRYISKPQLLARALRQALAVPLDLWAEARLEHERFYKEVLGMEVLLTDIRIPDAENDINMPLIIHNGLMERFGGQPIEGLFQIARSRFSSWKYTTDEVLGIVIPTHDRHPKDGSYAILVRNRVEADEENKNLSADDCREKGIQGETVLERIFHELFHHWKTGKHLDVANWTLCSGSRTRGGRVPYAYWHDSQFRVDWYYPSYRYPNLRPRSVRT